MWENMKTFLSNLKSLLWHKVGITYTFLIETLIGPERVKESPVRKLILNDSNFNEIMVLPHSFSDIFILINSMIDL